ncbi:hypothetical protein HY413_04010 [Candidatus Kaiserbacteria bacterium]|nr:hypothetical protein [Candidatus Kaiserbacteria bacterium]
MENQMQAEIDPGGPAPEKVTASIDVGQSPASIGRLALSGRALVPVDFSKEAVSKAVLAYAAKNPLVTLSFGAGFVGLTGILAAGWPIYFLLPFIVGAGAFGVNYGMRYDANARTYLEHLRKLQRDYVEGLPHRVRQDLEAAGSKRGVQQLDELEQTYDDFKELLERKFTSDGLTLSRFLGTAEQVRAGALLKLQLVADQLKAIESIPADLEKQLKGQKAGSESARLIEERITHRTEALTVIEELHTAVEASLTRLSELSVRTARVGMDEKSEAFEACLADLQSLARQASAFKKEH